MSPTRTWDEVLARRFFRSPDDNEIIVSILMDGTVDAGLRLGVVRVLSEMPMSTTESAIMDDLVLPELRAAGLTEEVADLVRARPDWDEMPD